MPTPQGDRTKVRTRLARQRVIGGYTQADMARLTGLTKETYVRLERGQIDNPPIRYLANCAWVLYCEIADISEEEWLGWTSFDASAPRAPKHPPPKGKILKPRGILDPSRL